MDHPVYFNTVNDAKMVEIARCFEGSRRPLRFLSHQVTEILELDLERVVRAKAAAAYREHRVPLIVEHGGLFLEHLKGLPGPMIKPMWDRLGAALCDLIPAGAPRRVIARSAGCYCDGRTRVVFLESLEGTVAERPRGEHGCYWDPVFIPEDDDRTLGEMTLDEKLRFSPSARVYAALRHHLRV